MNCKCSDRYVFIFFHVRFAVSRNCKNKKNGDEYKYKYKYNSSKVLAVVLMHKQHLVNAS